MVIDKLLEAAHWRITDKAVISTEEATTDGRADDDEQKRYSEIVNRRQLIQQESAEIEEDMTSFTLAVLAKAFQGEL